MFLIIPDHKKITSYIQGKRIPKHEEVVSVMANKIEPAKKLNPRDFDALDITHESFKKAMPYIKEAERYAKEELGYEIPKGLLPSIFMQESSAGTNITNKNSDLGNSAYMLGLAKEGIGRLNEIGFKGDYNNPEDVFKGAARLLADKSKVYEYDKTTNTKTLNKDVVDAYSKDPALFYTQRYYGGKEKEVYNKFKQRLDYYSNIDY